MHDSTLKCLHNDCRRLSPSFKVAVHVQYMGDLDMVATVQAGLISEAEVEGILTWDPENPKTLVRSRVPQGYGYVPAWTEQWVGWDEAASRVIVLSAFEMQNACMHVPGIQCSLDAHSSGHAASISPCHIQYRVPCMHGQPHACP